jgi:methylation protein EvaC
MSIRFDKCRCCNHPIEESMTFGQMPIANAFMATGSHHEEYFFEMATGFCSNCYSYQLLEQPDAEMMFHENYAFYSRQSKFMQVHFKKYADWVLENYIEDPNNSFVVEMGSNDGIMLENFAKRNIKHLGVDPSENVVIEALKHGVQSIVSFFGFDSSKEIQAEYGHADAIISANVMCHLPDLNDIAKGAFNLLKDKGVLIFEDPYLGSMLEKVSYDQIYDEHVYIFSALSASNIFSRHGFELINLLPQDTHGGSMRYVFAKKGERRIEDIVTNTINDELSKGFDQEITYINFKNNCEKSKSRLQNILQEAKNEGKSVAGYGATSKSTTILNYCGIGPDLISFISDTTPIKQNTITPGMHIPVKSYEYFKENIPDIIILFAWNHANEIIEKEKDSIDKSVTWITHLPGFELTI